jgi:hypothetical protein
MADNNQHRRNRATVQRMRHRRKRSTARSELDFKRSERRRDIWRIILQGIGGAAVLAGLWFTSQDLRQTQAQTARQLELVESGQITDRFSRAVDQLGDQDAIDVRIGGIYALERIAKDSPDEDRPTVAEVLSAFVVRATTSDTSQAASEPPDHDRGATSSPVRRPDIRAALTVLARLYQREEETGVDLRGADLRRAELARAQFRRAILTGADLRGADVSGAFLVGAFLVGADLSGADVSGASLVGVDLSGASLVGADVSRTILQGADLSGADLSRANLSGAELDDACASTATTWPAGFDPAARGVRITDQC